MDTKQKTFLILILVISSFLRFYNLMHDAPYFFNPDERNMANAVSQLRLPARLSEIPNCLISQLRNDPGSSSGSNDPGSSTTINCNLNPHFFAYGQFPLYLAYTSDILARQCLAVLQGIALNNYLSTSFPSAIFWLRFYSALFSTLTVIFVYLITKELFKKVNPQLPITSYQLPIIAAIMAAFSPGLIQSAHFGTTESLLTFFFLLSVYVSLSYLSNLSHLKFIILNSLIIGLALGSKLTGIFFFVPPATSLIIKIIKLFRKRKRKNLLFGLLGYWVIGLFIIVGSIAVFCLSSPYNLVDPGDFQSAVFGYESDVAMGRYEAFYTRQFVNTTPIIFQAEKIFPYALGWPVFILGTLGFLMMLIPFFINVFLTIIKSIKYHVLRIRYKKKKNINILNTYYLIFTTSFLLYLLPNSFLFAKWTRFMTPILPFFSIFAGYFLYVILGSVSDSRINPRSKSRDSGQARMTKKWGYLLICLLVFISILPGVAFMSIYTHDDSRLTASKWIYKNIPVNSYILSETANVVDIPLGIPNYQLPITNYQVISFDFYHIDENPSLGLNALLANLEKADYVFIPSRRIFANYTRLPRIYPLVTKYYQLLNSGALGFEKVAEINSYPAIGPFKFPDENAEETFTVFDHPVIRIYRKTKPFTIDEYRSLFNI